MVAWTLVPCLVSLRTEFNLLAPDRDKASDGSIGDAAHAASKSDHNPAPDDGQVHAIDTDANLRKAGWDMQRCVDIIVGRHRKGQDDRLQNVIYNRRIWSRSWGWIARAYDGPNPHTEHAHFSARYTTAQENDTRPWGLLAAAEAEDDMTRLEMLELLRSDEGRAAIAAAAGAGVHNQRLGRSDVTIGAALDKLLGRPVDSTDEAAIVAGVLAGLDPAAIAAAIPAELAEQVADELAARLAA